MSLIRSFSKYLSINYAPGTGNPLVTKANGTFTVLASMQLFSKTLTAITIATEK